MHARLYAYTLVTCNHSLALVHARACGHSQVHARCMYTSATSSLLSEASDDLYTCRHKGAIEIRGDHLLWVLVDLESPSNNSIGDEVQSGPLPMSASIIRSTFSQNHDLKHSDCRARSLPDSRSGRPCGSIECIATAGTTNTGARDTNKKGRASNSNTASTTPLPPIPRSTGERGLLILLLLLRAKTLATTRNDPQL